MNRTRIAATIFSPRIKEISRYANEAETIQLQALHRLLQKGERTEWGKSHRYHAALSYTEFAAQTPVNTYEELKVYIERMRHGEPDLLWPGKVKWYAKSSGTTNDKSKFIPVSADGLKQMHYRGGMDTAAVYMANTPKSRMMNGKGLILGGSHAPNYNLPNSLVGDLSAILIENASILVNYLRAPSKSTALIADFELKRERIAQETVHRNITSISGVPSWMLSVLNRVIELSGKSNLSEVWPNLEVFFHGGVAFTPYREQYKSLISSDKMTYMETYNASEGFFGLQNDLLDPAMLLMLDYDVFYEFIPLDELDSPTPNIVPLWGVEIGKNYSMLITTPCGLWRYMIGDTVRFTQKKPYKFLITGRTKHYINAFGEELVIDNAEQGLEKACRATGAQVLEYTAAPVFMNTQAQCSHQWIVEFSVRPNSLQQFAKILDESLQAINSDYEAKRYKNITLQPLEIVEARRGLFTEWLKIKGKLGGQHKVPRLSNTRQHIDELLRLNDSQPHE